MEGSWTTYHKSFGSNVWLAVLLTATVSIIVLVVINQVGVRTAQPFLINKEHGGMYIVHSDILLLGFSIALPTR